MKIYVGNLPFDVTEDDVVSVFDQFGDVASVNLVTDRVSGEPKGFGFVEMPNKDEAGDAITALDESPFKGRNLKVNRARPRGQRPPRRSQAR